MAQWREFSATNEEGTCLWCGRRLRFQVTHDYTIPLDTNAMARGEKRPDIRAEKPGDYEDGFFCGLRCAYMFAKALAGHGRRLQPVAAESR